MKVKFKKFVPSNKILIKKLNIEGRARDNNIEKILSFKKPKALTINPKLADYKINNNDEEDNRNRAYNEALKIVRNFNKEFKNNIKNYNIKKNENQNFKIGYQKYKKVNEKQSIEEIQKKNYIFGQLLNSYYKRGIKVPEEFFYSDIYKDSGLLLVKKRKIDEFFEEEVVKTGEKSKKAAKTVKFLEKISDDVEKVFRKRLLNYKGMKKVNSSVTYEYENFRNSVRNRTRTRIENYDFFGTKVEKINKQQKEIKKLIDLISKEEEDRKLLLNKRYNNNSTNNIHNSSNNYIESFNSNTKNKRKINSEYKLDDTLWNQQNLSNYNNSNSFNNNELCTSSTFIPKNNNNFFGGKLSKNSSQLNLGLSSFNDSNNINIENNSIPKKIINNNNNMGNTNYNNSNITIDEEPQNLRLSMGQEKRKKTSNINIMSLNKIKMVPPLYINKIKGGRRQSYLPKANFSSLNTTENRNSNKTEKDKTNTTKSIPSIKSISIRKVNSQPNILNKTNVKDIYEKINSIHFHPFKKFKNEEKINGIYKNYYGNKMKKYENNKKSQKELLKNYFNIKANIIQNEDGNDIYSKYWELLPKLTMNKIRINKEQNKILKEQPLNYVKALYHKKYMEFMDKSD